MNDFNLKIFKKKFDWLIANSIFIHASLGQFEKCIDEAPDEFNFGLVKRKAIYKNYEGALPDIPVIDNESFTPDKKFLETYKECIDLNQKEETLDLKIGAILLCTGFDLYEPKEGEFGYKEFDNVITLHQFKRIIDLNDNEE